MGYHCGFKKYDFERWIFDFMNYSFGFDKEKMKKDCKKLIGISNLGEKALEGYTNRKYSPSDSYSILELAFLKEVVKKLSPNTYWCRADITEKDRLLAFYKAQITGLFEGREVPYEMTDYEDYYTDRFDCFEEFDKDRMILKDFYDFITTEDNPVILFLKNIYFVLIVFWKR